MSDSDKPKFKKGQDLAKSKTPTFRSLSFFCLYIFKVYSGQGWHLENIPDFGNWLEKSIL